MLKLHHYSLCPYSRMVRLALGEYRMVAEYIEERGWERRPAFLSMNPAGTTPVMIDGDITVCGSGVIAEYLEEAPLEKHGPPLMPAHPAVRAEVRRLMGWFDSKFNSEVTVNLVTEKIDKRFMPKDVGGGAPNMTAVRAGLANIRYHMKYISYLAQTRNWLAGDSFSYADLAAAAQLSCVDYLGDVPWNEEPAAKDWYARVKSRPSFRAILTDQLRGVSPPPEYADLDF